MSGGSALLANEKMGDGIIVKGYFKNQEQPPYIFGEIIRYGYNFDGNGETPEGLCVYHARFYGSQNAPSDNAGK